jgi:hypothetical protein
VLPSPRYHFLTVTVYAQEVDFNFSYTYARGAEAFECLASNLQETTSSSFLAQQTNASLVQQTSSLEQTNASLEQTNASLEQTNASLAPQQTNASQTTSEAYEVRFVATLAYSSPAAFTDALRVLYRKGVVAAMGMDPEREYARVSLSVAAARRRRLLEGTIAVTTAVALDSQAAAASAAAAVNETSLRQAVARYGMVLTAMTPPTWSSSAPTKPLTTPAPTASEEFPVLLVVALGAGVALALLVVCACACLLHRSRRVAEARYYSLQASDSDDE